MSVTNKYWLKTFMILIFTPLLLGLGSPLAKKTKQANELYNQGKYDKALETYRDAQVESPDSAELHFNIGNALFKEKKYEDSIKEFNMATENTNKAHIESQAYYNTGVSQFRLAELDESMGKIEEALKKLELSMESNRQAMRLNPDDEDPKYNFEQAKRKWKELYSRYKQEQPPPEEQKQEQQQKEQQEGQEQQQEQQQEAGQKEEEQKQAQPEKQESQEQQEAQQMAKPEDKKEKQEMTEEDVMRILNSLEEEDKEAIKRAMPFQYRGELNMERDW